MDRKIRVGAVSYLNTKPLIYGFEQGMMKDEIELVIDYPANIADALIAGKIDIGLIPVAALPQMKEYYIIGDYCIGCDGPVASVCLFSEVPLDQIETVLLDYQSRTSVLLVKILLKEYWKINPVLISANAGYENSVTGTTAAVIIGDRALKKRIESNYTFDLGQYWKAYTGLPFLFAAWVSRKPLTEKFIFDFNQATGYGLKNIENVIAENPYPYFDLNKYYSFFLKYNLDELKRKGLKQFLNKIENL